MSYSNGSAGSGLVGWPAPVQHKTIGNFNGADANNTACIPDLNSADGSVWVVSLNTIKRIGPTGAVIWTITNTADVNAAATVVAGFMVDYTDGKIYAIFSSATTNTYYFISNPLLTKAVTVAAINTTFSGGLQNCFLDRPGGQGAGNLRIFSSNLAGPAMEYRDISTAGVLQGVTQTLLLGGVTPGLTLAGTNPGACPYVSQAGNLVCSIEPLTPAGFLISRGGTVAIASSGWTNRPIYTAAVLQTFVNGSTACVHQYDTTSVVMATIAKTYTRNDWDTFLNTIADAAGCL